VNVPRFWCGGPEDAGLDEADSDVAGHEQVVKFKEPADGDTRYQVAEISGGRQAVQQGSNAGRGDVDLWHPSFISEASSS